MTTGRLRPFRTQITEFGAGRPDFGGRWPRGEALGQRERGYGVRTLRFEEGDAAAAEEDATAAEEKAAAPKKGGVRSMIPSKARGRSQESAERATTQRRTYAPAHLLYNGDQARADPINPLHSEGAFPLLLLCESVF